MRSVARPVANLGNTCYMNAVLQALAHAPDLQMAMDCEPHHKTCPVAQQRRQQQQQTPTMTSNIGGGGTNKEGTRKSSRRTSSTPEATTPPCSSVQYPQQQQLPLHEQPFCALCELEHHFNEAHDTATKQPVAPSGFVHGFVERVAPWFQLGVQEDSHEFLRLLIDAMQKSCKNARDQANAKNSDAPSNMNQQDENDEEYPFSLFRGQVESNVVCGYCKTRSSTRDPIEDVGLEVSTQPQASERSSRSSSRNSSPTLTPSLWDVKTAFHKYARREALDSNYKCEKCGKEGKATKQTRLASIPPILTLHLKRFRYGDRMAPIPAVRRSNRSEVSQLGATDYNFGGKSGASKVEGHVKFELVLDLKEFLTDELQHDNKTMYCRLFAVIVHAGTTPHSGHYIAFVRNIGKNEWWKMDDSRVTPVSVGEVLKAEAYMLFYRVMNHPVTQKLEGLFDAKVSAAAAAVSVPDIATTTETRKRPSVDDDSNVTRKSRFPPHLQGLVDKMTNMLAEDMTSSDSFVQTLQQHNLPGAVKYKRMLYELFYQLKDHRNAVGTWLARLQQVAVEAEPDETGLL